MLANLSIFVKFCNNFDAFIAQNAHLYRLFLGLGEFIYLLFRFGEPFLAKRDEFLGFFHVGGNLVDVQLAALHFTDDFLKPCKGFFVFWG